MSNKKRNMYKDARIWNVVVGCYFDCKYCKTSFQAQMKRQMPMIDKNGKKRGCQDCYDYIPHFHEERLTDEYIKKLPKTTGDQFIWCCSSSDIYFAKEEWIRMILERVRELKNRTFFFQSKAPEVFEKYDFPSNVILGCYDEKTRVLTTEGLKTYLEIKEGDIVFSLNNNKEIEQVKVKRVFIYPYKGKMIKFKGRSINLLVTPDHQILTLTRTSQTSSLERLRLKRASDIINQNIIRFPKGHWISNKKKEMIIDGKKCDLKDVAYLMGIYIGDGWEESKKKKHINKTGLNRQSYYQSMRGRKEQYLAKLPEKPKIAFHLSTRIVLCIPENNKARLKVEDVLKRCFINYHPHEMTLFFSSKEWYDIFDKCGHGAKNKTIPRWLLEQKTEVLKSLFEGLMDSDGCEMRRYVTVSIPLLSTFAELCIKLGLSPHITKRFTKGNLINGRKIKDSSAYHISVGHVIRNIRRENITKEFYDGKVWCISVGVNKNFIVEREGCFVFCGNCTLETNRDYPNISKAPAPDKRYNDFLNLDHPRKAVTLEPLMEFDLFPMVMMIKNISPERVYIGYDSRKSNLNEPSLVKTNSLMNRIKIHLPDCKIKTKLIREKVWLK